MRPELVEGLLFTSEEEDGASTGSARTVLADNAPPGRIVFSEKFACPVSGFTIAEIEPRLFSFNNPFGACPACDGLGEVTFFDPKRVVAFPHLSLAGGAIRGWDRRNQFYFQMLQCLATHYGFDLEQPYSSLTETVQQAILHGVYHGVRGMVKELVENYATELGQWPDIIATGGDATFTSILGAGGSTTSAAGTRSATTRRPTCCMPRCAQHSAA